MKTNSTTNNLRNRLKAEPDIGTYIEENKEKFIESDISSYIAKLSVTKNISIAKALKNGQIRKSYGYMLSSGERKSPSRDVILQLCFGFKLDLDESQRFLRYAQHGELYPKFQRDSIIMYCLDKRLSLHDCRIMLKDYNLTDLVKNSDNEI